LKRMQTLAVTAIFFSALLSACAALKSDPGPVRASAPQPSVNAATLEQPAGWQAKAVRNVILMIGDGMGINHIWLTRVVSAGTQGRLTMERMPFCGLITTSSASDLKTDSAAAATALATGRKTANGMIAELPDGTRLKTLLEKAEERKLATGLVVTKAVTDATPAAFGAHSPSRSNQSDIAAQILDQGIDVVLGGGRVFWRPVLKGGTRTDGRDLISEAVNRGYRSVTCARDLEQAEAPPLLGLLAENAMTGTGEEPSLAAMTAKAIALLSTEPQGFFLMVEGSRIDSASHRHAADDVVRGVLGFDDAVKEALDYAVHDGHTLVIVTADHETGGLVVLGGTERPGIRWAGFDHSSSPVALFAYGPGADDFTGMLDNTEVALRIAALLGFEPFPQEFPSPSAP